QRMLTLNPRDAKSEYQLADIWMQRKEFVRAEAALRRAAAAGTEKPVFLTKLGECYIELRRYDEAERSLRDALQEKADDPLGHYVLADVYSRQGRERDAQREAAAGRRLEQRRVG